MFMCTGRNAHGSTLLEHEIHRQYQADHRCQMIPMQLLSLEEDIGHNAEDDQGDDFLDYLELHEREGTAVAHESDAVGRHLEAVFQESYSPRKHDDSDEGPRFRDTRILHLQVAIPGQSHKQVAANKQSNRL